MSDFIKIATIIKPHGVHGGMTVFSEVENLFSFKQFAQLKNQDKVSIKTCKQHKGDVWIISIDGVTKIEKAEEMRGVEIFCNKDNFPKLKEGEFYEEDVIGFDVVEENDEISIGKIESILHTENGKIVIVAPFDKNFKRGNVNHGKIHILRENVLKFEDKKAIVKTLPIFIDLDRENL